MEELTNAEEKLMKILWKLKKAFLKDIMEELPEPKPAKTTIATFLKRMVDKRMVGYNEYGRLREYFPKVTKSAYFSNHMKGLIGNFFNNSKTQFASFFTSESDMTLEELKALQEMVEAEIKKKEK